MKVRAGGIAAAILLTLLALPALAQQIVSVRVFADHPQFKFYVDDQYVTGSAVFSWPAGSKHILRVANVTQVDVGGNVQFTFTGWKESTGFLAQTSEPIQVVTAAASITYYQASVSVQYRVNVQFASGIIPTGPAGECLTNGLPSSPPGVVYVGGACYRESAVVWLPAGTIALNAIPYSGATSGFVFLGWSVNLGPPDAYLRQFTLRESLTLTAHFAPAKRVVFYTSPPELKVTVDRTDVPTASPGVMVALPRPGTFDFAEGSRHILSAPSPQMDLQGKLWVFDSWSIGGGQGTVYTATVTNKPEDITAYFKRGVSMKFYTQPAGLKLRVDGQENWPSYNFVWAMGTNHNVTAPAEQVDARGRKYVFKGWTNGGPASQELVADPAYADDGWFLTARYELLGQAKIESSIAGVLLMVNGGSCLAPCVIDEPAGSTVDVMVPPVVPLDDNNRWDFVNWSDNSTEENRQLVFDSEVRLYRLNYRPMHRLMTASNPEGAATFRADPSSPDGFYAEGTRVRVFATAKTGYQFRRWEGNVTGTFQPGNVILDGAKLALAVLDEVTQVAPSGVRNAAGETPEKAVAAGSVVSIFGAHLAKGFAASQGYPLPQTLAGVTVEIGSRILPLYFVSPEQINAQLPVDLSAGPQKLTVKGTGYGETEAEFEVTRNAPGLFSAEVDGKQYAVAFHQDGSAISPQSPVKKGETVTLLATGLGPYDKTIPEGFAPPEGAVYRVVDAVSVAAGDGALAVESATAAPAGAGIQAVKVRIPASGGPAGDVQMRLRVAGKESNAAFLTFE